MNRFLPGVLVLCAFCCLHAEAQVAPAPPRPAKTPEPSKPKLPPRPRRITPENIEAFVEIEKIAVLDEARLGMILNCHTPTPSARSQPPATGQWGWGTIGYLLVVPLSAGGIVGADRVELFGPLWDVPGEKQLSGNHRYDLSPKGVAWLGGYGGKVPFYDLRQSQGLIRWQQAEGLSEEYLARSFLDLARRKWTVPQMVSIGVPAVSSAAPYPWMEPGRFSLRRKGQADEILIYDVVKDRFVDDSWLVGLMADVKDNRRLIEHFFFTDDGNWLIALPNRWPIHQPPDSFALRGAAAERARQFWVFQRGRDAPWVVDAIEDDTIFITPRSAFVDKAGKLLLGYHLSNPPRFLLASCEDGKTQVLKHVLRKESLKIVGFDSANSTLIGYSPSDVVLYPKAALDQEGAPIGFSLRITKWKYLEGKREAVGIHLDDLLEVRQQKAILKARRAIPIGEETSKP